MHSKFIILSGLETPEVDATIIILVIEFEFKFIINTLCLLTLLIDSGYYTSSNF